LKEPIKLKITADNTSELLIVQMAKKASNEYRECDREIAVAERNRLLKLKKILKAE